MITLLRWVGTSIGLLACLAALSACTSSPLSSAASSSASPAASAIPTPPPVPPEASPTPQAQGGQEYANLPRLNGDAVVEMVVNGQTIQMTLHGKDAPITAGNFVDLVSKKVYDGLPFHRVVRDPQPFVVQGGDPQGHDPNFPAARLGTGGYIDPKTGAERDIPLEILPEKADGILYGKTFEMAGLRNTMPKLKHLRGAVAMARSQFPNSASSQFYIALQDLSFLDGNYAVFGYVTQGMEAVDKIQQGDRIQSMRVVSGIENFVATPSATTSASPSSAPSSPKPTSTEPSTSPAPTATP